MIASLARAGRDGRAARRRGAASRPSASASTSSSPPAALHMKYKLRMEPEEVLDADRQLGRRWPASTPMTWSGRPRTAAAATSTSCAAASRRRSSAGATTINLPDTVGYALPEDMERMFTDAPRARAGHREGDLLDPQPQRPRTGASPTRWRRSAPARARWRCTINGIGERAGNASLEEIVMAIRTRQDAIPLSNRHPDHRTSCESRSCSPTITGFDVQPNKAIVGRNAFAHEAGIHQDGVLKNAAHLRDHDAGERRLDEEQPGAGQALRPRRVPRQAEDAGLREIGDNQLNDAFRRFKDLADRKKVVFDEDIVALVDDEVMRDHERIRFVSLDLHAGSKVPPRAELELEVDGVVKRATASGDGPVDATFKAIHAIFPHAANLVLFSVGAVTEGTDAQAQDHGAARGERQDGRRPGRRYRHDRRLGARLCARAQQAAGEAGADGAAGAVSLIHGASTPPLSRERGSGGARAEIRAEAQYS